MKLARAFGWGVLLLLGVFRPGVDALDRRLAHGFWDVPSEWNAVADAAIRTGVVDPRIGPTIAPWRHASVVPLGSSRIAVVAVSDMHRSRVSFLNEEYEVLAGLERSNPNPSLVTDEVRGYKPLSHLWPLRERGGRIETMVAFASLVSEEPNHGRFAYLALGPRQNEVLFACDLIWGPGPTWGVLERAVGDASEDFIIYSQGRKDVPPVATFAWDDHNRTYVGHVAAGGATLVSWWSTTPGQRALFTSEETVDDVVNRVMSKVEVSTPRPEPGA